MYGVHHLQRGWVKNTALRTLHSEHSEPVLHGHGEAVKLSEPGDRKKFVMAKIACLTIVALLGRDALVPLH